MFPQHKGDIFKECLKCRISHREGRHYHLWKHTFTQVLKGCDVLAFNDPAYNAGTKRGKSLPPHSYNCINRSMPQVTWSFPCALFWRKSGDQLPACPPGTPDLPSVVVTLPTSTLSVSSSRKEVFPSNKDKKLVPYRRPSMQVSQLLQLAFANRAPSTFPVSLLDMGAEGPYSKAASPKSPEHRSHQPPKRAAQQGPGLEGGNSSCGVATSSFASLSLYASGNSYFSKDSPAQRQMKIACSGFWTNTLIFLEPDCSLR